MTDLSDTLCTLQQPSIADNSVLSNLIHAGQQDLLRELLAGPVYLSPTVLDPEEIELSPLAWRERRIASEFLDPLRLAARDETDLDLQVANYIREFAIRIGELWVPLTPNQEELDRAAYLAGRDVRSEVRRRCPDLIGRINLDAGEAETVAIAAARGMTILVDDQAAVNLLRCLYPEIRFVRTCEMLRCAAENGLRSCDEVAEVFNRRIVEDLGFYARRGVERLYLRCDPPACVWE